MNRLLTLLKRLLVTHDILVCLCLVCLSSVLFYYSIIYYWNIFLQCEHYRLPDVDPSMSVFGPAELDFVSLRKVYLTEKLDSISNTIIHAKYSK